LEVAVAAFSPLLDVLADVPDPRRAEGKLYKLPSYAGEWVELCRRMGDG